MSETVSAERSGIGLGLPVILALVFANLMGGPITSLRPSPARTDTVSVEALQTVPARLWRDPLEAAYAYLRTASTESADLQSELRSRGPLEARLLAREIAHRMARGEAVTLMPVLVPGGYRAEEHELRLRQRFAVVSALTHDAVGGIEPLEAVDPEHIGLARFSLQSSPELPGALEAALQPGIENASPMEATGPRNASELMDTEVEPAFAAESSADARGLLLPFEWFENERRAVVVLWVNQRAIQGHPLFLMADAVGELQTGVEDEFASLSRRVGGTPGSAQVARVGTWLSGEVVSLYLGLPTRSAFPGDESASLHVAIVGPTDSDTLLEMIEDDRRWGDRLWTGSARRESLANARVFSPRSTLGSAFGADLDDPVQGRNLSFASKGSGVRFERTIGTDRELAELLLAELRGRRPDRFQCELEFPFSFLRSWLRNVKFLRPSDGPLKIALISEVDTSYGRAWQHLLQQAAPLRLGELPEFLIDSRFHYMRGIDGRIPGRDADAPLEAGKEPAAGEGQQDYLRRLERALEGDRYDAIGILGSDVYDKTALLQVLRPRFPDALFFTTDVDARLLPSLSSLHTLNLLVASHYGLTLRRGLDLELPPLRSGYQLASFLAARRALQEAYVDDGHWNYDPVARVFEVGRTWIHQLENPHPIAMVREPRRTRRNSMVLRETGLPRAFWLVAGWQRAALLERLARDPNPLKDKLSTPWLFRAEHQNGVLFGVLLTVFVVLCGGWWWPSLRRLRSRGRRTLSADGVRSLRRKIIDLDALPGLFAVLFLVGLLFSIGLAKLYLFMRDPYLAGEPFFVVEGISSWPTVWIRIAAILVAVAGYFRTWYSVLAIKEELCIELLPKEPSFAGVYVERAWKSFQQGTRWLRVTAIGLLMAVVYYGLTGQLFRTLGGDVPPVRGERMYLIERFVLWWSVVLFILLVFVVLRVTVRSTRFIRNLVRANPEDWPRQLGAFAERTGLDPATAAGLMRVRIVQIVGDRIGPCVWWPATVLFLMVLSRANLFDRWSWPVALVVTLSLSFTLMLLSGHGVRLAARRLRDRTLEVLGAERTRRIAHGRPRDALEAVIADLRGLRAGVFAPLWEHPLLRAWLLPIAALGANTSMELWLPRMLGDF